MRYTAFSFIRVALLSCAIICFTQTAFAEMVRGKVLSPDGKPVAGAIVVGQYPPDLTSGLVWPRETPPVKTDADGAFRLEVDTSVVTRPPGPNQPVLKPRLVAGATGFAPSVLTIKPGEAQEIRLRPASALRGVVNDGDNKPLAGVRVRVAALGTENGNIVTILFLPNALADRYTITSDAQGKYTVTDVPTVGTAFILLTDERYGMTLTFATLKTDNSVVPAIVARPAGTLTGRILLPDGKPAVGVRVSATGNTGGSSPFTVFKTDATGTYKILGLTPGSFALRVDTTSVYPNLKAGILTNQEVTAGKTTSAADLKLMTAAIVTGKVTDAETNRPIAGVTIIIGSDSATTDAGGQYRLPVATGSQDIRVAAAPEGYIASAHATATLTSGASHTQDFALKRGINISGVVRTTDARPAPHVTLAVRSGDAYLSTITDAEGQFSFSGIERGRATFVLQTDLWEWEGASEFDVPAAQRLMLTVKKANVTPITGRVLDPAGKPVNGAQVRVVMEAKEGFPSHLYTLVTDSAGQYTVRSRGEFTKVTVAPEQSGYRYIRGGALKQGPDGAPMFEDMVVSLPAGKRTGRVVDEKGKPVTGALVVAAEGGNNSLALTDAQGRFTLSELPDGETQIFAAYRAGFTSATVSTTDTAPPTLTLSPAPPPTPANLANAIARWEALWNEGKTNGNIPRSVAVQMMAPFAPDRAVKLDENPDNPSDGTKETIIETLAKVDPTRAIAWMLPRLSEIRDDNVRRSIDFRLAKASFQTARNNDAFMLYGSIKTDFEEVLAKGGKPDGNTLARLAGLAAYARDPEAEALARRALETLQKEMEQRGDPKEFVEEFSRAIVYGEIGEANPRLVETLSRDLPKEKRATALASAILRSYRTNLAIAQTLLPLLRQADNQGGWRYSQAARPVVGQLATRNPTEALMLARTLTNPTDKALALAVCAREIKVPAERTAVFREAFDLMVKPTNGPVNIGTAAHIAAMAYPLDAALGAKLFAEARAKLPALWERNTDDTIVGFAFYFARVNRGESRALLESVWTRRKATIGPGFGTLSSVALAMAAVDIERANEMADSLPTSNNREYERFVTRCKLAQYLAFPSPVRRTLPFERWSRIDTWHPGMGEE